MLDLFKKRSMTRFVSLCTGAAVLAALMLSTGCGPSEKPDESEDVSGDTVQTTTSVDATDDGSSETEADTTTTSEGDETTVTDKDTTAAQGKPTGGKPTTKPTNRPTDDNKPAPKTKVFYVEDYGAKGDGKTDDGIAIANCVRDASRDDAQYKIVKLKPNTTYRVKSVPATHKSYKSVIQIVRGSNVTVEGNNTKLLMKAPMRVAYVNDSSDVVIKGLVVDYDPKPFALGIATKVDTESVHPSITFKCDYDLGFTGSVMAPQDYFAFRNRKDERLHFFIESMEKNADGTYTFNFANRYIVQAANVGDEFILPVYGSAHLNGAFAELKANENITMQDITIHALPDFGIGARRNTGKMLFKNITYKPAPDSKVYLTTWRDGFHIKDNSADILFDHCYVGPLGDDAFNIASVTCTVDSYNAGAQILNAIPDEDGKTRDNLAVGDEVIVYDNISGKEIGYAKIAKIIPSGSAVSIKLDKNLPVKKGHKLGIYSFNKNFKVKDSYIEGTVRVRSSGTFENCQFNVFWVRVENDTGIEGPIPKDVLFKNCTFTTPYKNNPEILHVGTNTKTGGSANYKCKNIVLDKCTFKGGFYHADNGNQLIVK